MIGNGFLAGPRVTMGGMPRQFGPRSQLEGLLGNPLFNAGVGLLSQSGYTTTPTSFGQTLAGGAQGLQQAQGFQDNREDRAYRNRDIDSRIGAREAQGEFWKAQADRMKGPQGYQPSAQYRQLVEAGYTPGTPEWTQAYNQLLKLGPQKREFTEDATGRKRYLDDGSPVFQDIKANLPTVDPSKVPSGYMLGQDGNSVVPIPGGPADPNGVGSPQAKEQRQAGQTLNRVKDALDKYRDTLTKAAAPGGSGLEYFTSVAGDEINSAYNNLLLEMKELLNLGVLNGPDLEIMERLIRNPGSFWTNMRDIPFNEAENLLKQLDSVVGPKLQQVMDRYGLAEDNGTGGNDPLDIR